MDIIDVINIINETYENIYKEFNSSFMYSSAQITFTNGYCYDFFCMLKRFYPNASLMMKNDKMHCAALIDDNLYDATGIRDDLFDFHLATGTDMEYIYKYYGFFKGRFKTLLTNEVVKNVLSNKKSYVKTLNK
ncbi:MAG TPA: hypothetical protein IAB68_04110 [Candidatus Aphodocola excrementigallinarum]|uniref:Uncharacterized protein n=1 Tax=Candidatus Aphodocola excrementigallinarum TaxID=2840670 RepID=A0A9D1LHZ5_9FIRM|nr:hypothetical protein [Candidatus Aphodocola excrementigallinarum]